MIKRIFRKKNHINGHKLDATDVDSSIIVYSYKIFNISNDVTNGLITSAGVKGMLSTRGKFNEVYIKLMCECITLYFTLVDRFTCVTYGREKGILVMDRLWRFTLNTIWNVFNENDSLPDTLFDDLNHEYTSVCMQYKEIYFNTEAENIHEIIWKCTDRIMNIIEFDNESRAVIAKCLGKQLKHLGIREFLDSIKDSIEEISPIIQSSNNEIVFQDGSHYKGESINGELHGKGVLSYPNGSQYIGEWRNGLLQGHGTLVYPDASTYEGEWQDGKMTGFGRLTYPDGRIMSGMWEDGKIVGEFKLKMANGIVYDVIIEDGEIKRV
jgi:hypothetical protein